MISFKKLLTTTTIITFAFIKLSYAMDNPDEKSHLSIQSQASHTAALPNLSDDPAWAAKNELSYKLFQHEGDLYFTEHKTYLEKELEKLESKGKNQTRQYQEISKYLENLTIAYTESKKNTYSLIDFTLGGFELGEYGISYIPYPSQDHIKQYAKIADNAINLHQQGFITVYHARYLSGCFTSDLVQILEEKKQGKPYSDRTTLMLQKPSESNQYTSITNVIQSITQQYNVPFESFWDQPKEWRSVGISTNIFLNGSKEKADEYTLNYYNNNASSIGGEDNLAELKSILNNYGIPEDRVPEALEMAKKHFNKNPHYRLYEISIHQSVFNELVKFTTDWGRIIPHLEEYDSLTFAQKMQRGTFLYWDNFFRGKGACGITNKIDNLQARVFVKSAYFSDPSKVRVTRWENGHVGDDKDSDLGYKKELQAWVDKNMPQ